MDTPLWYRVFSEREVKEIQRALEYKEGKVEFIVPTLSGDLEYTVIAKFAKLLDMICSDYADETKHDEGYIKNYLETLFGGK